MDRHPHLRRCPLHGGEERLDRHAIVERAGVGGLDHGAVCDRIAVGYAEFAERGARAVDRFEDGNRRVDVGITGRHEGRKGFALLLPVGCKHGGN